jgi:hypothetical protein
MNLPPDKELNQVKLKDIRDYLDNCKQVQDDWNLFKKIAYVFLMVIAVMLMFGIAYLGQMFGI